MLFYQDWHCLTPFALFQTHLQCNAPHWLDGLSGHDWAHNIARVLSHLRDDVVHVCGKRELCEDLHFQALDVPKEWKCQVN